MRVPGKTLAKIPTLAKTLTRSLNRDGPIHRPSTTIEHPTTPADAPAPQPSPNRATPCPFGHSDNLPTPPASHGTGGAVLPHYAEAAPVLPHSAEAAPVILAHIAAWHMQQVLHMQGGMCARAVMAIVVRDGVVR